MLHVGGGGRQSPHPQTQTGCGSVWSGGQFSFPTSRGHSLWAVWWHRILHKIHHIRHLPCWLQQLGGNHTEGVERHQMPASVAAWVVLGSSDDNLFHQNHLLQIYKDL